MPFSNPSIVAKGQLGWDSVSPVAHAYEFLLPFGLQKKQQYVIPDGVRGTLDQQGETYTTTIYKVEGGVKFAPVETLLSTILLQAVQGGTPTGTGVMTYPVADSDYPTYMTIDRVAKVQTYGQLWIDTATFESEAGGFLTADLDMFGQTLTESAAGSFPTGLVPPYLPPFTHNNALSAITINANPRQVERVSCAIHNNYLKDRFFMSQTLTSTAKQFRTYDVTVTVPYNVDNIDLEDLPPGTIANGVFAWGDGTKTLTFTYAYLQLAETPVKRIDRKGEIMLDCHFNARRHTTTDALSISM